MGTIVAEPLLDCEGTGVLVNVEISFDGQQIQGHASKRAGRRGHVHISVPCAHRIGWVGGRLGGPWQCKVASCEYNQHAYRSQIPVRTPIGTLCSQCCPFGRPWDWPSTSLCAVQRWQQADGEPFLQWLLLFTPQTASSNAHYSHVRATGQSHAIHRVWCKLTLREMKRLRGRISHHHREGHHHPCRAPKEPLYMQYNYTDATRDDAGIE